MAMAAPEACPGRDVGSGQGRLLLTEVMAASDSANQFVELVNTGTGAVDLCGATLRTNNGDKGTLVTEKNCMLASGQSVVLVPSEQEERFAREWMSNGDAARHAVSDFAALDVSGGALTLLARDDRVLLHATYPASGMLDRSMAVLELGHPDDAEWRVSDEHASVASAVGQVRRSSNGLVGSPADTRNCDVHYGAKVGARQQQAAVALAGDARGPTGPSDRRRGVLQAFTGPTGASGAFSFPPVVGCGPIGASTCGAGAYSLQTDAGEFCFRFGAGVEFAPSTIADCTAHALVVTGPTIGSAFDRTYDAVCALQTDASGAIVNAHLAADGHEIQFTACSGVLFDDAARKRASVVAASSTAVGSFVTAAAANGDPHLVGAHGEHYDFFGAPGAVYALFTTPQFVVNMQLWDKGPSDRYIERLGVVFGNVTHVFSTAAFHPKKFEQKLNRELAPVGGRATVRPFKIHLELCAGHEIDIVHSVAREHGKAAIYHLDVSVSVPGCHDAFGGALGETFRCRYAGESAERFVWDGAREESFRVHSLSAKSGAFRGDAPCHDVHTVFGGQSPMSGQSGRRQA